MHEQAQLRLKKVEVTKLGAAVFVVQPQDLLRAKVFKEENRLLSKGTGPFAKEKSLVFATTLSDPAGHASAIYGVSRKCARWGQWVENDPCWFVINRKGILTYAAHPTFATPTSYVKEVDDMLEAMKKAVIGASLLPTSAERGQANPVTPKQQYSAIFKEYSPVSGGLRNATTDLERKTDVERLAAFSSKFVELAANHPEDPIALTALRQAVQIVVSTDSAALQTWEMNQSDFPAGSTDGSAGKTVALVLSNHLHSKKLGPVIDRMRYGYRMEYEQGLRTILEKNPHYEIQALACLALAQFLHDKLRMLRLVEDRPELAECYNIVFGKDYLPGLERLRRANLAERIEKLFERAVNEYADVKFRTGTVGETATSELNDIRHLAVGKVAPDIEGKDQDGAKFKLSDYRGKVVLLYFWSEF